MTAAHEEGRPSRAFAAGVWLRRLAPLGLVCFALIYYGSYYRSGLNLGGEGGTVAVVAMRLMDGQLPIKDTFLGYNVMWFYPVVWLFQVTGPDYVALRIFFFGLCALTALMAYFILRRVSGSPWPGLVVGVLLVLVPGMIFRNYMGFLAVLNMLVLLETHGFGRGGKSRWLWAALSGLALGLTFLIRIDLGLFFLVLHAGAALAGAFYPSGPAHKRAWAAAGILALVIAGMLGAQAPFYLDARMRGFDDRFIEQYSLWWELIRYNLELEIEKLRSPAAGTEAATAYQPVSVSPPEAAGGPGVDEPTVLRRPPLRSVFDYLNFRNQAAILSLYLPVPMALILAIGGAAACVAGMLRRREEIFQAGFQVLLATGAALTLFPQYFFFRPDPPHLSEFMVPFIVAMAVGVAWAVRGAWRARSWPGGAGAVLLTALAVFTIVCHLANSLRRESAGTWAARKDRTIEFTAQNNVRVFLTPQEHTNLRRLYHGVMRHAEPGEYVICFPYNPTVNFMTDRPSYLWNLYVDDVTATRDFDDFTIGQIEEYQPAVIVVDNRDINRTEFSRFRNWAAATYQVIRKRYILVDGFGDIEIYVRPDRIQPKSPNYSSRLAPVNAPRDWGGYNEFRISH